MSHGPVIDLGGGAAILIDPNLHTDVGPHTLILDMGCGDGRVLTATALLRRSRGVGVDISEVGWAHHLTDFFSIAKLN